MENPCHMIDATMLILLFLAAFFLVNALIPAPAPEPEKPKNPCGCSQDGANAFPVCLYVCIPPAEKQE